MLTQPDTQPDTTARDKLLFGKWANLPDDKKYFGGVIRFKNISLKALKELQQIGCLDPDDYFNCSPDAGEFMAFMEAHPGFTAHGYAYHPDRYKEVGGILHSVAIEGIELRAPQIDWQTAQDFVLAFRHADDFEWEPDRLYCWYD